MSHPGRDGQSTAGHRRWFAAVGVVLMTGAAVGYRAYHLRLAVGARDVDVLLQFWSERSC